MNGIWLQYRPLRGGFFMLRRLWVQTKTMPRWAARGAPVTAAYFLGFGHDPDSITWEDAETAPRPPQAWGTPTEKGHRKSVPKP